MLRSVLVGVDGSEYSTAAVELAMQVFQEQARPGWFPRRECDRATAV